MATDTNLQQSATWKKNSSWATSKGSFKVIQLDPVELTSVTCENGVLKVSWAEAIDGAISYSVRLIKSDDPNDITDLEPVEGGDTTTASLKLTEGISVGSYDVQVRANGDDVSQETD